MTVDHGTFTIEKIIAASPANVFRAFAEEELKRQWFLHPGLSSADYSLEFGPRGREAGRFVIDDGPGAGVHENTTAYLDVVDGERICYAYSMAWDGRVHSASLVTITLAPSEAGCKLTLTEQGAYFPPSDGAEMRRGGIEAQLDALVALFA